MTTATATTAVPISSLYPDRYEKKKSAVYAALKELQINSFKAETGTTAYISFEDLAVLDEYMRIAAEQGLQAARDYANKRLKASLAATPQREPWPVEQSTDYSIETMQAIAQMIIAAQPVDVLAPQRQLKEAAHEGWVLSTRQVRQILGVASWSGGDRFGFAFEKAGKVGGQNGWRVLKA